MTEHDRTRAHLGRLALGALLLILGIGWLLQTLDVVEVRWEVLLAAALILVGVAIAVLGRHGGLITIGVILTIVLAFTSILDVSFEGGVGEREYRPESTAELQDAYRLAMGRMVVDLSGADIPEGTRIEASVGMGELVIVVPEGVRVRAFGRAGIGEVLLFDRSQGGFGPEQSLTDGTGPTLELRTSVGMGKVEVRR
jgi:hypothetical protein